LEKGGANLKPLIPPREAMYPSGTGLFLPPLFQLPAHSCWDAHARRHGRDRKVCAHGNPLQDSHTRNGTKAPLSMALVGEMRACQLPTQDHEQLQPHTSLITGAHLPHPSAWKGGMCQCNTLGERWSEFEAIDTSKGGHVSIGNWAFCPLSFNFQLTAVGRLCPP
jgi:hypothetical protein